MKCTGIAIATNLTLQALFNSLEYADYRKGMDGKMEEIEERLRKLEGNSSH
jgi:1,4-dihydroxy-2-naphthoate octaprenyltransferase